MGRPLIWAPVTDADAAVAAWRRTGHARDEVVRVEERRRPDGRPLRNSHLWRLVGAANGRDVIAKRAAAATVLTEAAIYVDVLERLPVPAPHCWGYLPDEADPSHAWLFLSACEGVPADLTDPRVQVAVGAWIGALHRETADQERLPAVPPQRWEVHRQRADQSRSTIERQLALAGAEGASPVALQRCSQVLARLERAWDDVRAAAALTVCLVHGDVIGKNVLVEGSSTSIIDWEQASWGWPAEDTADVAAQAYADAAGLADLRAVERLSAAGSVLRDLSLLTTTAEGLSRGWAERVARSMVFYAERLDARLDELR